ncbi:MAG: rhomboid family intramembrane serine protease [Caldiserica bacterium]|nr:rhomboid family intramembrane serine protease [Caldisericota bacterium]
MSGKFLSPTKSRGAISGLLGAYFIFFPRTGVKLFFVYRIIYVPAVLYLGAWILLQALNGGIDLALRVGETAWSAHIGRFTMGTLMAFIAKNTEKIYALAYG